MRKSVAVAVVLSSSLVACNSGPPVTDWKRALRETRRIEHSAVPLDDREGNLIDLVEDLVIEDRNDGSAYDFARVVDLVVDDAGRILVQDGANKRVQVFDAEGRFIRTIGGREIPHSPFSSGWIALSGHRLAVSTGLEIAVWSVDGDYLYDRSLMSRALYRFVHGTADGSLIGAFRIFEGSQPMMRVVRLPLDSEHSTILGVVPDGVPDGAPGQGEVEATAGFAVTEAGDVFLTAGDEYEVLAVTSRGERLYTLYVDWPRLRVREEVTDQGARVAVVIPEGGPIEMTLAPALSSDAGAALRDVGSGSPLRIDGHDHVYVFPYVAPDWSHDLRPVDVYSATGERLFAGLIPDRSWVRAKGDFVYGIERDAEREVQSVVRYRLVEPF